MAIAVATAATWALFATIGPTVQAARPLHGRGAAPTADAGDPRVPPPPPAASAHDDDGEARACAAAADDGDGACGRPEDEAAGFPAGWEEFSYVDIREHFDCGARSRDGAKPLPSLEDWVLLQRTYTRVVDKDQLWNDPVPPTLGYSFVKGVPAPPPYAPRFSPGKGRGLFASRDLRQGELVHDGTHSDVVFPTARDWRRFVFSLPPAMSCDCTDWHWIQRFAEGGDHVMLAGINISSLMNSGGPEYGPGRMPNALPENEFSGRFLATRDIRKGEEILTDYYAFPTDFSLVGL